MKKGNNYRRFCGIIALAVLLMFAVSACDNEGDNGPTKYTVSFDANGGTVSPSDMKVESGKTAKSLPTPVKTSGDTIFWGWYTKNGTGDDWGSPFTTATPVTADITVYARWGNTAPPTMYTVTFNADGGTVTLASKQVLSGDPAGDLPVPQKTNNTFGGWYTAQNGGGSVFTAATTVTGNITVYAKWTAGENNDPVNLSKNVQLTEANWKAILTEIETAGKNVNLDLSQCTRSGQNTGGGLRSDGTFDPIYDFSTGKYRIISLILPNAATRIEARVLPFSYCFNLTSVSSPTVTDIGNYAFSGCTSLNSVNFPAAINIGDYAFNFTGLNSASFPAATGIGDGAFLECTDLNSVNFPKVTDIGERAFSGCISLISISFPAATGIGDLAFFECSGLTSASFPKAISIGDHAFNLTGLTSASFPAATGIGSYAFGSTGTIPLTIILGPTAPTCNIRLFNRIDSAKTVTVKVPAGATGYGTIIPQTYSGDDYSANWGNGFRGGGWTGTAFPQDGGSGGINNAITLHVEYQD